jgi:hypothetical protein
MKYSATILLEGLRTITKNFNKGSQFQQDSDRRPPKY